MHGTTTQHEAMAAVAAARARYAHVVNGLMGNGSWSIPCTAPATFHKPRPRRSSVTSPS
jgi:hypothetical protein